MYDKYLIMLAGVTSFVKLNTFIRIQIFTSKIRLRFEREDLEKKKQKKSKMQHSIQLVLFF